MASNRRALGAAVGVAVLWGLTYGWPLVAVLGASAEGVAGRRGLDLRTVGSVLSDARLGRLAAISLGQTLVSVVLVVLVGVPLGWTLGRLEFRGRVALMALVTSPFVMPTLTIAAAVVALAGGVPDSRAARLGWIVAAHVCLNVGLMARSVAVAVAGSDPELEYAARMLGRGPVLAVLGSTLRARVGAIWSTALVVAMFCATSFGVIVALGGAVVGTIEVEVWYLTTRSLDLGRAAVLVVTQLAVVSVLAAWSWRWALGPAGAAATRTPFARRRPADRAERSAVVGSWLLGVAVCAVPLVALVLRSLRTPSGWSAQYYVSLFDPAAVPSPASPSPGRALLAEGEVWRAFAYSISGASVAAVVAMVIAAPMVLLSSRPGRWGRWADRLALVPLSLSAATLGLGYLLAFGSATVDLRGSWIIVPLVQAAAAAPVVVRVLSHAVRSLDRSHWEAAATSGAGRWRRLATVGWPQMRRHLAVAAGFAMAMSIGEFGATLFLSRADRPTVPILIGRLLGRPGDANLGQAMALSCLLALLAAGVVVAVDRLGGDGPNL